MSSVVLKYIYDPDEVGKIIPVISSAWGMPSVGTLTKDIVCAMRYHGGVVIGAYDDSKMVGMHFSFPGYRRGKVYLYSHMTGVISDLKYSGIGYMLKMKQKEWALDHGYDLIAWTHDPIQSMNANFNLRKLGTIARSYEENFYGSMDDDINRGIPSDRIVSEWWIKKDKKTDPAGYSTINNFDSEYSFNFSYNPDEVTGKVMLRIPKDYSQMKQKSRETAVGWRMYVRKVFQDLFSRGYVAVGFEPELNAYMLEKGDEYTGEDTPHIFGGI